MTEPQADDVMPDLIRHPVAFAAWIAGQARNDKSRVHIPHAPSAAQNYFLSQPDRLS
jgi:hypothetical protein